MDIPRTASLSAAARPVPPQRALSAGGLQYAKPVPRPNQPSRLNNVRSASQSSQFVDLTEDGEARNQAAFLQNRAGLINSPQVIDLDVEDNEPPAKKIKLTPSSTTEKENDAKETNRAHENVPGSPLPSLVKTNPSTARAPATLRRKRTGVDATRKADGTNPPHMATRIPGPKGVADFSPWTGSHPEDVLTETVIKGGYFDKGPGTSQSESSSAKASIWPNLSQQKNNMGLQTLSWMFAQVMEKRQVLGKCTASSTFKPPPRVTVTDTKREAWLRDLANTDIPLRKQSRTIPHGIRGKVLMEQCLGKDIPLLRAVWLAKCVGANELRAFRRKGVSGAAAASGETKWVREWTVSVEQFIEGVIASCGQPDWQLRMNYAVKLAASFYVEKLLDADHYLDWIVTSLSNAASNILPVWIVMAQMYWKDIASFVRRGRKLAETLLGRLHRIMEEPTTSSDLLKSRLQKLITVLATTNRGCLIIPQTWEKYKYLLAAPKLTTDEAATALAHNIINRNERLSDPLRKTPANTRSPLLELYNDLDACGLTIDVTRLINRCFAAVPEISELVSALLDWASTPYRQGVYRTYLAARLISELRHLGNDTDSAILRYLGQTGRTTIIKIDYLYKAIGQVARLDSFSVGRYMQWLITSGALSGGSAPARATGLLAMLPSGGLPRHMQNTRTMLLQRLGSSSDATGLLQEAIDELDSALNLATSCSPGTVCFSNELPPTLQLTFADTIQSRIQTLSGDTSITLGTFCVLRDYLEQLEEMPLLAELLAMAINSESQAMLATVTDTINLHAESFAALARLDALADGIVERYRAVRSQQVPDRTFIQALASLVKRLRKMPLMKLLESDLAVCDQQNTAMACSPASDNLVGMDASKLDSDDDIDAVFASGNSMDQQLMQRVFTRIAQHATKATASENEAASKVCRWLRQLRSLDWTGFDQMVANFLKTTFETPAESVTIGPVTCLVASGCITITSVADAATKSGLPQAGVSAIDILLSPTVVSECLHPAEKYRYHLMQERFRIEQLDTALILLHSACQTNEFKAEEPYVVDLVVEYTSRDKRSKICAFEQSVQNPTVLANYDRLCMAMMKRAIPNFVGHVLDPTSIFRIADPLSVRLAKGMLGFALGVEVGKGSDCESVMHDLFTTAVVEENPVWPQLLGEVGPKTQKSLHDWAQEQLLFAAAKYLDESSTSASLVYSYVALMDVTKDAATNEEDTPVMVAVTDKLRDVERQLTENTAISATADAKTCPTLRLLDILLHICILHVQATPSDIDGDAARTARAHLLLTLCSLLVHPKLQSNRFLTEYIFDLASSLADTLPDTVLAQIPRSPSTTTSSAPAWLAQDPRIDSILGSISGTATRTWLGLASSPSTGAAPSSSGQQPGGTTQQQRALNKHASAQHMANNRQPGGAAAAGPSQQQRATQALGANRTQQVDYKVTPYPLRRWEIIPDPTPVMGENDTSLSLGLFGARKV